MRLPRERVVYKHTEQKKKADKRFKVSKKYNDRSLWKLEYSEKGLNELTYGMIDSCNVELLILNEDAIVIHSSWTGLVMFLLGFIYKAKGTKFLDVIAASGAMTEKMNISTKYGMYSLSSAKNKVYQLPNTGYFVEANFDTENVFFVLTKLFEILGFDFSTVKFGLRYNGNVTDGSFKELVGDDGILISYRQIEYSQQIGRVLKYIIYKGKAIKVSDYQVGLWLLCCEIFKAQGEILFDIVQGNGDIGFTYSSTDNSKIVTGSSVYFFDNGDLSSEVEFISNIIKAYGLTVDDLSFLYIKAYSERQKHEYELD